MIVVAWLTAPLSMAVLLLLFATLVSSFSNGRDSLTGQDLSSWTLTKRLLDRQPVLDVVLPSSTVSSENRLSVSTTTTITPPFASSTTNRFRHLLVQSENPSSLKECDTAFVETCLPVDACYDCFVEITLKDIDWVSIERGTSCEKVVEFLLKGQNCLKLSYNQVNKKAFCDTFDTCVQWDDKAVYIDDHTQDASEDHEYIDCDQLSECKWDGMRIGYVGNGICNDDACYNTHICNYDGGDCCQDTCNSTESLVDCGHDGYYCRDPQSSKCNPELTDDCTAARDSNSTNPPKRLECNDTESLWNINMYDSWGDGWDDTSMVVTRVADSVRVFSGSLSDGEYGYEAVCLNKKPTCYRVEVKGGIWGKEASWEIKPWNDGAPAVAGGGAPMDCIFPIGGADNCVSTCTGKPNIVPNKDPEYKQLKDMYTCIQSKCMIQVNACNQDTVCKKCFQDEPEDYCFGNAVFNALIDCSICKCSGSTSSYCASKSKDFVPSGGGSGSGTHRACTPSETIAGAGAVMDYSKCVKFDQVTLLVPDYDTNNFGPLDKFEACAHSYNTPDHGGHTALGCLQILVNTMNGGNFDNFDDKVPKDAVIALAKSLYEDTETFCDCSKKGSDACPLCQSFMNFKTLLYESLDACQALDEIDCDAWSEFALPCKTNLGKQYSNINFAVKEQCDYVKNGCGGVGPFPAFRHLDCDKEVSAEAWSFYLAIDGKCLTHPVTPIAPKTNPTSPENKSSSSASGNKPYVPPPDNNDSGSKPYVPPPDGKKPYIPPEKRKSKRSWFWSFFWIAALGGVGFYFYKKRTEGFSFIRYRRMRNHGYGLGGGGFDGANDMYMGLSLESSTSFEPPHLPPTPASMGAMGYQ